jgi:hypothetical protein
MANYYVNNNAQTNGDHEVHKEGCTYMPNNKQSLGNHTTCHQAVTAAKQIYSRSNGCYWCSRECHTS